MIKKVTVTQVYKSTEKKDGTPYVIKNGQYAGQSFTRIGIKTEQTGDDVWYTNAKEKDKAISIQAGDSVLLNLVEEDNGNGGTWKNFNYPTKEQLADFAASIA